MNLASGNLVQVRVWCNQLEQSSVNTFYYRVGTVIGIVTDQNLANQIDAVIAPLMKPILQNNADYQGVTAQILNATPRPIPVQSTSNAGPGTGGAVGLPRQACGFTRWLTDFAGPRNRGRTYWPFPGTASDQDQGVPSDAYLNDLTDLVSGLRTFDSVSGDDPGDSAGTVMVIHSQFVPSPVPIRTGVSIRKWATQRKRGSFGRANSSPLG